MATVTIVIEMDTAAFFNVEGRESEGGEVSRILREYAAREHWNAQVEDAVLRDVNGNAVGTATRTE